jgi:RNA polymerase sigma-70 factor (ECF subfamily)
VTDLGTPSAVGTAAPAAGGDLDRLFEQHRRELTGYCYRMLGGAHEAEDAVQETMLRAWRAYERFEHRASVRSWLFRIATNVCIEMLRGRKRRAVPVDLEAPARPGERPGPPLTDVAWVQPMPDARVLPDGDGADPAERAVARESVRLAFVAALQHLSPRQRAVLILRDVLRWRASEVAHLLGATVVSVNSALQRGRAALASATEATAATGADPEALDDPDDPATRDFLDRYVDAFSRFDVERLVALLHEDVTLDMPPLGFWLAGPGAVARWMSTAGDVCRDGCFVPVGTANGAPAFGLYHRSPAGPHDYTLAGIHTVEVLGGRALTIHAHLDPGLAPLYGLPPGGSRAELVDGVPTSGDGTASRRGRVRFGVVTNT